MKFGRFATGALICWLLAAGLLTAPAESADCSAITCYNGGTCNNYTVSPPCQCALPYIAPYCIAAVNYCNTSQPSNGVQELPVCKNGGNCTLTYTDPFYNCTCAYGYTGLRCNETDSITSTTAFSSTSSTVSTFSATLSPGQIAGISLGTICGLGIIICIIVLVLMIYDIVPAPESWKPALQKARICDRSNMRVDDESKIRKLEQTKHETGKSNTDQRHEREDQYSQEEETRSDASEYESVSNTDAGVTSSEEFYRDKRVF